MKVQEAAHKLLVEEGRPLSSRELARRALDRGWVTSASDDPVFSIASTIEKTIRHGRYNRPELAFLTTASGRRIGLPNWNVRDLPPAPERKTVSVQIPADLADKITLAAHARLAPTFDATAALLIRRGLAAAAPEIKSAVMRQLEALERLPS